MSKEDVVEVNEEEKVLDINKEDVVEVKEEKIIEVDYNKMKVKELKFV